MTKRFFRSPVTTVILALLVFLVPVTLFAVDGKKWDGKKYVFSMLDPEQPNSEANPFIIDTAGKLAYLSYLGNIDLDLTLYGKRNGIKGLGHGFNGNWFALTQDLDMNGKAFELAAIGTGPDNFDGRGHTISNLRISDTLTKPFVDADTSEAEIMVALFGRVGNVRNLNIGKGSSFTFAGVYKDWLLKVNVASIAVEAWLVDNCTSEAAINVKSNGDSRVAGIVVGCPVVSHCKNSGSIRFEGDILMSRDMNKDGRKTPGTLALGGVLSEGDKQLSDCSNSGAITVKAAGESIWVGGVAGRFEDPICANLENTGAISFRALGNTKFAYLGGVVGWGYTACRYQGRGLPPDPGTTRNSGAIDVVFKTGKIVSIGGISGGITNQNDNFSGNSAKFGGAYGFVNAFNTGGIKASSTGKVEDFAVGGIAGSTSMVFNSYNSATITAVSGPETNLYLGGLGGDFIYTQNSYNCGNLVASGTGSNLVGGLIGNTNAYWGDTENFKSTVFTSVWFRDVRVGGVNAGIKYAKGSYNGAASGYNGTSYIVESPGAVVLLKSDDEANKRKDFQGSLVDLLNGTAAGHADRFYRLWKVVPGVNGGFPVFQ